MARGTAPRARRAGLLSAIPRARPAGPYALVAYSRRRVLRAGDGERIVVCHSLACALWYQAWATATLTAPADRVLLVAPPGKSVLSREITREFDPGTWRPDVLAPSSRAGIRLVGSDADPNSAEGPAALVYGDPLDLDSETIPAAGHLTPADGYGPWPAVLEWCCDSRVRLSDC
jgi:predicted alpha/beta hydrolase family esterase